MLGFLSSSEPFIRSIELAMRGFAPFPKFVVLYTALYAAFGVISPFLPAFLQSHDLATEEIAAVMATGTGIRLFSGPLAGRFANHHRAWRRLFAGCRGTDHNLCRHRCAAVGATGPPGCFPRFGKPSA